MFDHLRRVRGLGVAILLVEQNARHALVLSDYAYVLDSGQNALSGPASELIVDPHVEALYLGGRLASADET
jgi:branched-chain amino acid transport system ATP-binding protein